METNKIPLLQLFAAHNVRVIMGRAGDIEEDWAGICLARAEARMGDC